MMMRPASRLRPSQPSASHLNFILWQYGNREGQGQLYTLSLLEQLRCECKGLWGASSGAYFRVDKLLRQLADPNLPDIPSNPPFRVEIWDGEHIRRFIAASRSVALRQCCTLMRRLRIIRASG